MPPIDHRAGRAAPLHRERGGCDDFGNRCSRPKAARQDRDPSPLGGIAISADSRTVVAVDDTEPALLLIDTERERLRGKVRLRGVPQPAQIARYSPDWSLLAVTSMNSGTVTLIDPSFEDQTTVAVGSQPMDMAFYNERLFVACQGDGSIHVIDVPGGRQVESFAAGVGCECLGFF